MTATLLAIYLMLKRMQEAGRSDALNRILADDIIFIQPSAAYVGTESFEPLERSNGEHLYLTPNELNKQNDFCSSKVEAMYQDAARHERSMLLDVTSPAVTAAGNIYTKAVNLLGIHPHAVAIVVSGREIWRKCGRDAQPAIPAKFAEYRSGRGAQGSSKVFQTILTQVLATPRTFHSSSDELPLHDPALQTINTNYPSRASRSTSTFHARQSSSSATPRCSAGFLTVRQSGCRRTWCCSLAKPCLFAGLCRRPAAQTASRRSSSCPTWVWTGRVSSFSQRRVTSTPSATTPVRLPYEHYS